MNRLILLAAVGAATATMLAPPSTAVSGDAGFGCGMVAVGANTPRPTVLEMQGGPFYASGSNRTSVTIRCVVQAADDLGNPYVIARAEQTTPTNVGVLRPTAVIAGAPVGTGLLHMARGGGPTEALYLCTEVEVNDPGVVPQTRTYYTDADGDPSNGAQCDKTEPDNDDLVYVWHRPPTQEGDWCLYWGDPDQNWPPQGACLPAG